MHEELSLRLGSKETAMLIDTGVFALMHLITDIARGMSWDKILVHVGTVSLNNLIFDLAYDKGGLPLAVACHAAGNFAGNILAGFLYAGVPLNRRTN
jgi:membrane protease YdiL (CAAX protease family)